MEKSIRLYPKDRANWCKELNKYAGKIIFKRHHAYVSTNNEHIQREYKWGNIWDILLHSLLDEFPHSDKGYQKRYEELDQHMFNVLRFLYQAPLLHYAHLFKIDGDKEMETQRVECFILKSSDKYFYMGEYIPHLYLVVRSPYNLDSSYICDLTDTKNDDNSSSYGNYRIYLE